MSKLKVIELQCQNIMKAKSVHIKPDASPVVVIGGNNGEGKTSVMESLVVGLCGKRERVAMPVSKGEQQGAVRIGLGVKPGEKPLYIITQRLNPDSLKVKRTDGQPIGGTPRSVLDAKLGRLAFDPLALTLMTPEEQANLVRSIYGIDVSALEAEYATVYEDRHQANASLKTQKTILETYAGIDFSKLPDAPIDVAEAMQKVSEINGRNSAAVAKHSQQQQKVISARSNLESAQNIVSNSHTEKQRAEQSLIAAQEQLDQAKRVLETEEAVVASAEKEWKAAAEACVDPQLEFTTDLEAKISTAGEVNALLEKKAQAEHQGNVVDLIETNVANLNTKLEEVKASKTAAVSAAELPQGLSFVDKGLELNGVPFEQASTTEQITIGFELALKDDPEIGVTFVRNASLLDKKHRAHIEELSAEYDVQPWFEVVGDDDPNAFILEDGEVVREPIAADPQE